MSENKKICISISTYDAFEDINISANILRSNWNLKEELFLLAGLCKKNTSDYLDKNLFNSYLYINTPNTHLVRQSNDDASFDAINARLFNSIIQTGNYAIENKCDYIIYLNSGSWILKPNKILQLIKKMKNKTVGVRVLNRFKYLIIDDHFLIVDLKKAKIANFFDISVNGRVFNTLSASINGIHGILRAWLNLLPFGEICVYNDHSDSHDEFGNQPFKFNPLIFDDKYFFLHSNKKFDEVRYLRSAYLEKYLINKNQFLLNFINKNNKINSRFEISNSPIPHLKIKLLSKIVYFLTFGKRGMFNKKRRWLVKINGIDSNKIK